MFREQVSQVSNWFDRWSSCERTVALVALLRRLQPTQARFITSVLHKQLSDCAELRRAEILANDPNFVANFEKDRSQNLVRDILFHLPLLNPKNNDVKMIYLGLIPKVLAVALDHCSQMEEARQILSYSLIHPAFTVEDRGLFATWLHQFEEKLSQQQHNQHTNGLSTEGLNQYPLSCSGSPPSSNEFGSSWSQQGGNNNANISPSSNNASSLSGSPGSQSGCIGNFGVSNNLHRIRRSNSLTPPVLHSDTWTSTDDMCSTVKPRSLSLSSEISPQSSGSESHLLDDRPTFCQPGMRDVQYWLKSLRLHKYAFLFAHLTFEEMMSLTEEMLEAQGVTKGARHKIVLSIGKLKERPMHLKKLLDEMTPDNIRNALSEIKWMLTTPIKQATDHDFNQANSTNQDNSENGKSNNEWSSSTTNDPSQQSQPQASEEVDIPTYIVRVVGKACEINPDMECEGLLISVLDKCLSHDAFSSKQKRVLSLWRQQLNQLSHIGRRNSGSGGPHFHHRTNGGNGNTRHNRHFSPRVLSLGSQNSGQQQSWTSGNSIQAMFMAKRPSLQDSILESARSHLSVQRTRSAPIPNFFSLSSSPPNICLDQGFLGSCLDFGSTGLSLGGGHDLNLNTNSSNLQQGNNIGGGGLGNVGNGSTMDITSRLESLCLSMTEAALGHSY